MATISPGRGFRGVDKESAIASIRQDLGIDAAEIAARLKAVYFGAEDAARMRELRDVLAGYAEEGAGRFIAYLLEDDGARTRLRDEALVEEIRRLKATHIAAMAEGEYGMEYVDQRLGLAVLHGLLGLEMSWFFGAYHHVVQVLEDRVLAHYAADPARAYRALQSLQKVTFFDLGLMVDVLVSQRERTIQAQQEAIRELSTPVLVVRPGLLIVPVIGLMDSVRASQLTEQLLRAIRANRARVVLLDVTGAAGLDSRVANHLLQTVEAARLMGSTAILSGVSPEVAQTMVTLGVEFGRMRTVGDLQGALEEADRLLGYQLVAVPEEEA